MIFRRHNCRSFKKILVLLTSCFMAACVTSSAKKSRDSSTAVSSGSSSAKYSDDEPLPDADIGDCKDPATAISKPTPFYIPSLDIFMTDFTNHCRDSFLVEKDSDWAGMRVPCTEGSGKIEKKGGTSANPDVVGFPLDISCNFIPSDQPAFEAKVNKALGLIPTATSLAINPLSVQYFEIEGSNDADVGNVVLLRTYSGLDKFKDWSRGPKGKSIKVDLFGRENAWGSEQQFYHYKVEIVWANYNAFRVKVLSAEKLTEGEKEAVGARCRSLKPKRACHLAF